MVRLRRSRVLLIACLGLLPPPAIAAGSAPPEAAAAAGGPPAAGRDAVDDARPPVPEDSLSIFAGVFTTDFWGRSFSFADVAYEPNFIVGLLSGTDLLRTSWGLTIGHESGVALRFGTTLSLEIWRGLTISFGARQIGGWVLTPELVLGLSSISNAIGLEIERELETIAPGAIGDVDRLIYLGSEVGLSLEALPEAEVFYRLHHRSGAIGFWGNVAADHNANVVGLRLRY